MAKNNNIILGGVPGCWTGVELIRPNFPTTTVRKTATVVAVASAVGEAAGHMSSNGLSAPCSAAAFHVPFIVVTLRRVGRFFFADACFRNAPHRRGPTNVSCCRPPPRRRNLPGHSREDKCSYYCKPKVIRR